MAALGNPANLALGPGLADKRLDATDANPSADASLLAYGDRFGLPRWLHPNGDHTAAYAYGARDIYIF